MAKKSGQYASVSMNVDGTDVEVMHLREWSVSVSSNKIEAGAAGEEWETHIIGKKTWEGEATCIDADAFWLEHLDSTLEISFYDHEDDAEPVYVGNASLDFERSVTHDDLIEASLTFTGNGELTHPSGSTGA